MTIYPFDVLSADQQEQEIATSDLLARIRALAATVAADVSADADGDALWAYAMALGDLCDIEEDYFIVLP